MDQDIVYLPNYISQNDVDDIRNFYDNINDSIYASQGPYQQNKNILGWQGCWDRNLYLQNKESPIHKLIARLENDFGHFHIYNSSIRYLAGPFLPHSDIVSNDWLRSHKEQYREGYVFLIPLSWKKNYRPGTAILSSPPKLSEPLYEDVLEILPRYSDAHTEEMKNFSVKKILEWRSPGDLIAWKNFQWHTSCHFSDTKYTLEDWQKEFINFKTGIPL